MLCIEIVALFNFAVDFLLMLSANRLCGYPSRIGCIALAAGVGGLYGGACLMPECSFLGHSIWCIVVLFLMSWIAFGWSISAVRRGLVFVLLSMALGGIAMGFQRGGMWTVLGSCVVLCILCRLGFGNKNIGTRFVPVDITYENKHIHLMALADTGNTLKDPVTGGAVLVIGERPARELTGLSSEQLRDPVSSIGSAMIPGLRLIPYKSVGCASGFMLGLRIHDVTIAGNRGTRIVAFSPEKLDECGVYQALTGGTV